MNMNMNMNMTMNMNMNMNMNMTMNRTNGGISNTYRCLRSGEEDSETESSVNHLIYDLVDVL
jgi:hypothetical protein